MHASGTPPARTGACVSDGAGSLQDELLLDTGIAKLTDFGLSKTIASVLPPPPLFGSGARQGGRGGEFAPIPECSSSGMPASSVEDSGAIPPLRLDGFPSSTLIARELSAGALQAHVPPQPRPGAPLYAAALPHCPAAALIVSGTLLMCCWSMCISPSWTQLRAVRVKRNASTYVSYLPGSTLLRLKRTQFAGAWPCEVGAPGLSSAGQFAACCVQAAAPDSPASWLIECGGSGELWRGGGREGDSRGPRRSLRLHCVAVIRGPFMAHNLTYCSTAQPTCCTTVQLCE